MTFGDIFDRILSEETWKQIADGNYCSWEELKVRQIERAVKKHWTVQKFEHELKKNVKELLAVKAKQEKKAKKKRAVVANTVN